MDIAQIMEGNNLSLSGSPSLLSSFSKMSIALLLVLGLMFLLYYISRKILVQRGSFISREKLIKVLANNYIGVKKQIALVEVAGEWLVLGLTPNQISLLTRIERKDSAIKEEGGDVNRPPLGGAESHPGKEGFENILISHASSGCHRR